MTVEEITKLWEELSVVDETDIALKITQLPSIHHKFMTLFLHENAVKAKLQTALDVEWMEATDYYRSPSHEKPTEYRNSSDSLKSITLIDVYVRAHAGVTKVREKLEIQEAKIKAISGILKQIENMHHSLAQASKENLHFQGR